MSVTRMYIFNFKITRLSQIKCHRVKIYCQIVSLDEKLQNLYYNKQMKILRNIFYCNNSIKLNQIISICMYIHTILH